MRADRPSGLLILLATLWLVAVFWGRLAAR
jgi:hypothetical protein